MKKTLFAICIFAVSSCALAETETIDGITWNYTIEDGEARIWDVMITTIPASTGGVLNIPSTLDGCPVTLIGGYAFRDCSGLASVTIPDSVTSIGQYAFSGCSGLAAVAIPSDWAAQYPGFAEKFGNDFGAAITAQTGKRDCSGNPMFVGQDFVAGTDPTDPDDVFTASITFDAMTDEPIISWSPELSAAEAAKRSYTTYGKVRLTDPTGRQSMATRPTTTSSRSKLR